MIFLGVVRGLLVNRSIHKVYLIELPLLMISHFVIHIWRSAPSWWLLGIAHTVLE